MRPPGAVPPPPRGTPQALVDEIPASDESTPGGASAANHHGQSLRVSTSLRHIQSNEVPAIHERTDAGQSRETNDDAALDVPEEELSAPRHPTSDLPAIPYDPDSLATRPSTPNLHVKVWSFVQSTPRSKWISLALLIAAASSLTLGSWLTLRRPERVAVKVATATTTVSPAPPLACLIARPAQRVAPSILMQVAPIAADHPTAGRLLLGFAEGPATATGISLDPSDLDVAFPFRETKESRVVSVTPVPTDGHPNFYVLRENQTLRQARAVDAAEDFLFGLSDSGFARQPIGGTPETIWAVDAKANVTDPRLSSIAGQAHAVTFRYGGQSGSIQLGWLTQAGRAMSGPFQVKSPVGLLGTPTLATDAKRALVAYAGRANDSEPWAVHLSFAPLGQPPEPASMFTQPPGGPGGDSIAPAIVALPNRRWLLQWSEGAQGQRQVRVQTLDSDGRPLGVAHSTSPVGSNSGQGLLWSSGQRAVSLFVVSIGRSAELWATPITCPE